MLFESLLSQYWWALVLRGLAGIVFGVLAFMWPGVTLFALVFLFGFYAIADGIGGIIIGIKEHGDHERWWATLLSGLVSLFAGIAAFVLPGITMLALLTIIAVWAIVRGVFDIIAAIRLRRFIEGEWLLACLGVLSIVLGLALLAYPGTGLIALAWWIGAYALAAGAMSVVLGFRLRTMARAIGA